MPQMEGFSEIFVPKLYVKYLGFQGQYFIERSLGEKNIWKTYSGDLYVG